MRLWAPALALGVVASTASTASADPPCAPADERARCSVAGDVAAARWGEVTLDTPVVVTLDRGGRTQVRAGIEGLHTISPRSAQWFRGGYSLGVTAGTWTGAQRERVDYEAGVQARWSVLGGLLPYGVLDGFVITGVQAVWTPARSGALWGIEPRGGAGVRFARAVALEATLGATIVAAGHVSGDRRPGFTAGTMVGFDLCALGTFCEYKPVAPAGPPH